MPPKTTTKIKVGDKVQIINKEEYDDGVPQFENELYKQIGTVIELFQNDDSDCQVDMVKVKFANGATDYGQLREVTKVAANYRIPKMHFIVIWDEEEDPCEFFATLEEAKEKAMELVKDEEDNEPHNIRIVEIKSLWKVEPEVKIIKQY